EAEATAITVYPAPNYMRDVAPYFTEEVRRVLAEQFDEETLLDKGLRVFTSLDVERYRSAEDAVYEKLRMVDKRQGFRGPLAHFDAPQERQELVRKYTKELEHRGHEEGLVGGELYVGLVREVDRDKDLIELDIGPHRAILPLEGMKWARAPNPVVRYDAALLRNIPRTFRMGDVLLVRACRKPPPQKRRRRREAPEVCMKTKRFAELSARAGDANHVVVLEQEPDLETAVLSLHNESGYVLALLGGYSFDRSQFNRATQSCRQPGSAFKPIVYSAAIKFNEFTLAQKILDAPFVNRSGINYKPGNFGGSFQGEVSLRFALQHSMNIPAIRVLEAVKLHNAIGWARHLGITTKLRPEFGLALGASCVKMVELADVYRTFASGGVRSPRRMILRIEDRDGRVLLDQGWPKDPFADSSLKLDRAVTWTSSVAKRLVDRNTSYLITKMMRNVVEGGTGTPAKKVGVPVAGKTGTTNDSFDAWFMGVTPELTTAVWVGFDDYDLPMGRYEQGGRAALPIWVNYMKSAVKNKTADFRPPESIHFVTIDHKTGERRAPGTPGSVEEAFIRGTEPAALAAQAGESDADQFFLLDD
ncbi:MAG: penicillin-binding transpeptidase domain-containing protein, partial [Myxococcota bacterium]